MATKISYLIHSLKEAGTTVQALNYCNAVNTAKSQTTLVTVFQGGAFSQNAEIKCPLTCLGRPSKFETLIGIYRLIRHIRSHKPDILISGAKRINLWAIIAKFASFGKTKLIITLTNDLDQRTKDRPKGRWLEAAILKRIYRSADMTLILTPEMRDQLITQGFPEHKLTYAPPPIDLEEVVRKSVIKIDHPWLVLETSSRDIPVIVATGRLSAQKNYGLLLRAFAKAQKSKPMRLIILGTGNARATAEVKTLIHSLNIEPFVDLQGFKPNPYPYLKRANVFALSSNWEGFGIVLLEALACSTTIVSTDCPPGPNHILKGGEYGYMSPVEDLDAYSNALLKAIEYPLNESVLKQRSDTLSIRKSLALYQSAIDQVLMSKRSAHVENMTLSDSNLT